MPPAADWAGWCKVQWGWKMSSTPDTHTTDENKSQGMLRWVINRSFRNWIMEKHGFTVRWVSETLAPAVQTHTPWNQNLPLRSSCAAPETGTVLSLRWYCRKQTLHCQLTKNEVAAKNRWKNLQHKRHLQSRIIWKESDLMVGCIPLPSLGQRLHDRNGKADSLTS